MSPTGSGQTSALLTLGAGQLGVSWGLRTRRADAVRVGRLSDPLLPLLLLAGAMLASATLLPPVRLLLDTVPVGTLTWVLVSISGVSACFVTRLLGARSL